MFATFQACRRHFCVVLSKNINDTNIGEVAKLCVENLRTKYQCKTTSIQTEPIDDELLDEEFEKDDFDVSFSNSKGYNTIEAPSSYERSLRNDTQILNIIHMLSRGTVGIVYFNPRLNQFEPLLENWTFLLSH